MNYAELLALLKIAELETRIAKAELAFAVVEGRNAELEANLRQAKKLLSQNAETMSGMTHSNILLLDRIAEFGLKSCTIDLTAEQGE